MFSFQAGNIFLSPLNTIPSGTFADFLLGFWSLFKTSTNFSSMTLVSGVLDDFFNPFRTFSSSFEVAIN